MLWKAAVQQLFEAVDGGAAHHVPTLQRANDVIVTNQEASEIYNCKHVNGIIRSVAVCTMVGKLCTTHVWCV